MDKIPLNRIEQKPPTVGSMVPGDGAKPISIHAISARPDGTLYVLKAAKLEKSSQEVYISRAIDGSYSVDISRQPKHVFPLDRLTADLFEGHADLFVLMDRIVA